jgi:hypothetical protein
MTLTDFHQVFPAFPGTLQFSTAQINMPAALAWELFEEGLQKAERTAEAIADRVTFCLSRLS